MAGICDVPLISNVCDAVGEGTASLIAAPFDFVSQAIAGAASWLFESVWTIFDTTTLVDVTSGGYLGVYNVVFGIAVLITFAFFCLQLIGSVIRREPGALGRAATGMAKSILGGFILVTIIALLLEIVDQLCVGIVHATGTTIQEMGVKIGALVAGLATVQFAAPGVAALLVIFLGFLAMAAAAIVWFSLLVRKALILVGVVLGPIALAGAGWDVTRGWLAKWATFVLALIFSKFIVVLIFLVAITQVNAPIDLDLAKLADPLAGIVLMGVAGFAPYMCYKLLAFAGVDMYHLASTEQEAKQAMNRPLPLSHTPKAGDVQSVLQDKGTASGGSPDPAPPAGDSPAPSPAPGGIAPAAEGGAVEGASTAGTVEAGSAAGPVGLGIAATVEVVKGVAEAGPAAGNAIGGAAEAHTAAATDGASAPPSARPQDPVPTSPAPAPQQTPPPPRADPMPPRS